MEPNCTRELYWPQSGGRICVHRGLGVGITQQAEPDARVQLVCIVSWKIGTRNDRSYYDNEYVENILRLYNSVPAILSRHFVYSIRIVYSVFVFEPEVFVF